MMNQTHSNTSPWLITNVRTQRSKHQSKRHLNDNQPQAPHAHVCPGIHARGDGRGGAAPTRVPRHRILYGCTGCETIDTPHCLRKRERVRACAVAAQGVGGTTGRFFSVAIAPAKPDIFRHSESDYATGRGGREGRNDTEWRIAPCTNLLRCYQTLTREARAAAGRGYGSFCWRGLPLRLPREFKKWGVP